MKELKQIKLSTYELPKSREITKGNMILWGPNHLIPQELIATLHKSGIHRTIVKNITRQLAGNGFQTQVNGVEDKRLEQILNNANSRGESFDDILRKVSYDYYLFGGFSIQLNWNMAHDRIVEIFHVDFSTIASGLADNDDTVTLYYQSFNWGAFRPKITPIKAFDLSDRSADETLLYYKPYSAGRFYYPEPDYWGAGMKWIEIDNELSSYKVNGLKNRFSAGMIVSIVADNLSGDEKAAIHDDIESNFTGKDNNETFMVEFVADKEHAATITTVPTADPEAKYGQMQKEKTEEILWAHGITSPLLVGVKDGAGFSSNADELMIAYEIFFKQTIEPKQTILEKEFSKILGYMGYDYSLQIDKILPFNIQDNNKTA